MRTSRILGPVVAALVVAVAGLLAPPTASPAHAADACAGAAGVIVVVDFNELGGGVTKGCDPTPGHNAQQNFTAAGYDLGWVPGQSGMVCTIQDKPAQPPCDATDAYWSLWWSDGKGDGWTYSTAGVGGLRVPAGGYVAFAWHQGSAKAAPPGVQATRRTAPAAVQPSADPTHTAPAGGGSTGTHGSKGGSADTGGGRAGAPSTSPTAPATAPTSATAAAPSSSAAAKARRSAPADAATLDPGADPSDTASTELPSIDQITAGPPRAEPVSRGGSHWSTWLAIAVGVAAIGAAAAVPLLRRRSG